MSGPADAHQTELLERIRVHPGPAVGEAELPRVAIVILNYNGRSQLESCFASLAKLDYPADRRSVWLVDNGSGDGSQKLVKRSFPDVRLVANKHNKGFSGGCNQGAKLVHQEEDPGVLVFLNNDMRVEPDWLRELVAPLVRGECDATTAKMLSWNGKRLNSAGGGMNYHGMGIQKGYDQELDPSYDVPSKSLFACGGAMAVRAEVFREVGGFDEDFFAYYEDVDLGWRMWVLGFEVHYVPSAVCYHHHSSTSASFPMETVRLLQVRNPVLACFKNYDDANLTRIFGPMLALAFRRVLNFSGLYGNMEFRIEYARPKRTGFVGKWIEKARGRVREKISIRRGAAADILGINDLLENWDDWSKKRREIQSARKRTDEEIKILFHQPLWCIENDDGVYRDLHRGLIEQFGIDEMFKDLAFEAPQPRH